MMNSETRARLEAIADELEGIARSAEVRALKAQMSAVAPKVPNDLFAIAWDVKQIARWGTSSFGV